MRLKGFFESHGTLTKYKVMEEELFYNVDGVRKPAYNRLATLNEKSHKRRPYPIYLFPLFISLLLSIYPSIYLSPSPSNYLPLPLLA